MGDDDSTKALITSEQLSSKAVGACWSVALLLLAGGLAATFLDKPGAAAATMLALGAVFLLLALMKRIPLRIEVAGTKLDASYPTQDEAFDAGREDGVREGLEVALRETEDAQDIDSVRADVAELLERWTALQAPTTRVTSSRSTSWNVEAPAPPEAETPSGHRAPASVAGQGYRGPAAATVAGVTYRQLDYWARTGLVEPTIKVGYGQRLYSLHDIVILAVTKRLLDTGVSLQQIRGMIERLKGNNLDQMAGLYLMSDGRSVYEVTNPTEITDLVSSGGGWFGIALDQTLSDVRRAVLNVPSESLD